jgi:hypothetical protein
MKYCGDSETLQIILTKLKNIPASLLGSSVTVRHVLKEVLPEIAIKNVPANLLGSSFTVRYI